MITTAKTSSILQGFPKYRSMLAGNPYYVPPAFDSIASATGTGSSGTISFTSIPNTYTHLQIRASMRTNDPAATTTNCYIQFNTITGASYTYHYLLGNGTTASAAGAANQTFSFAGNATATSTGTGTMAVFIADILDYANTSKNKTVRVISGHDQNGSGEIWTTSSLFMSTSAISSVQIIASGTTWTTASTFSLYGIQAA